MTPSYLCMSTDLSSNDMAAWVQAIGSILAIAGAVVTICLEAWDAFHISHPQGAVIAMVLFAAGIIWLRRRPGAGPWRCPTRESWRAREMRRPRTRNSIRRVSRKTMD